MKKVLSALVLSAAVVATAGQAYAYDDFNLETNGVRGTLMGILYTEQTEIYLNLGDFLTTNNTVVFDHQFTETDKLLATVDYKSILANRGDTGEVHMSYTLHDMVGIDWTPRYSDVYYATTSNVHGGEVPAFNGQTTGEDGAVHFQNYEQFVNNAYRGANLLGSDDVIVMEVDNEYSWHNNANYADYFASGAYAGINEVSAAWGEADFNEYSTQCEIDMYLWLVRHDSNRTTDLDNDVNSALGIASTIRFDQRTGAITLNPTDAVEQCAPVPVPAAAWLLGSGVLGLFGLRRRNA
jgi:hypothetical protein